MRGIYAIHRLGTNRLYVGESSQATKRVAQHMVVLGRLFDSREIQAEVVLELPTSTKAERELWEARLIAALQRKGCSTNIPRERPQQARKLPKEITLTKRNYTQAEVVMIMAIAGLGRNKITELMSAKTLEDLTQ